MSDPSKRREQVSRSVKRHRSQRDRLEVYIPQGWREKLKKVNDSEGLSTSAWVRSMVALRIGEDPPEGKD
mgnify:CR=1 FL=1